MEEGNNGIKKKRLLNKDNEGKGKVFAVVYN
jgi:hypothetical protein